MIPRFVRVNGQTEANVPPHLHPLPKGRGSDILKAKQLPLSRQGDCGEFALSFFIPFISLMKS